MKLIDKISKSIMFPRRRLNGLILMYGDVCGDGVNVGTRRKDTNGSLRNISEELAQDTGHSV